MSHLRENVFPADTRSELPQANFACANDLDAVVDHFDNARARLRRELPAIQKNFYVAGKIILRLLDGGARDVVSRVIAFASLESERDASLRSV